MGPSGHGEKEEWIGDDCCESGMRNWETEDAICQTGQWRRSQARFEMPERQIN